MVGDAGRMGRGHMGEGFEPAYLCHQGGQMAQDFTIFISAVVSLVPIRSVKGAIFSVHIAAIIFDEVAFF